MEGLINKFESSIYFSNNFKHGVNGDIAINELSEAFEQLFPVLSKSKLLFNNSIF